MTTKKIQEMLETYINGNINGNISDFKKGIEYMSKYELLDFLEYCNDENVGGTTMIRIIKKLL